MPATRGDSPAADASDGPTPGDDAGDRALWAARHGDSPAARRTALAAWLERYPHHPRRAVAERLLAALRLEAPRVRVTPGGAVRQAVWLDRERFVTASDRVLAVWRARDGGLVARRELRFQINALAATAAGDELAVGGRGGQVAYVDVPRGLARLQFALRRQPLGTPVRLLTFSPDGRRLAVAESDAAVLLLPLPLLQTTRTLHHRSQLHALLFSPDGRRLFTGCGVTATATFQSRSDAVSAVRCWVLDAKGDPLWRHALTGRPQALAFDPAQRLLAVGTSMGQVLLLDAARGRLRRTLSGPVGPRGALGARLAHSGGVYGVAFSSDGRLLYTCGELGLDRRPRGGGLRAWRVETGALLREQGDARSLLGLALRPGAGEETLVWDREAVEVWPLR